MIYAWEQNTRLEDAGRLGGDGPHADHRVGVPSEEGLTIGGPRQRDARGGEGLGLGVREGKVELELVDDALALKVPDPDPAVSGGAEPVPVGGEAEGVDDVALLAGEGVEALALVQVPEHGHAVLAARGAEGAVRGDGGREGDAGPPLGVAFALGHDGVLALAEGVPELDGLVAGAGDDLAVVGRGGDGEDV